MDRKFLRAGVFKTMGSTTYQSLQRSDLQTGQDLTGLITVSDVLESFRTILTTDIEKDLLTTTSYDRLTC